MTKILGAVWAQAANGVIGRDGTMPWYAPEDLAHFKSVTLGSPVIMGRLTWESFPARFRPLPGRLNIVVSSTVAEELEQGGTGLDGASLEKDGAVWVSSFEAALARAESESGEKVWLIGGGQLFEAILPRTDLPYVAGGRVSLVERTLFSEAADGAATAPELDTRWKLAEASSWETSEKGWIQPTAGGEKLPLGYRFETWIR